MLTLSKSIKSSAIAFSARCQIHVTNPSNEALLLVLWNDFTTKILWESKNFPFCFEKSAEALVPPTFLWSHAGGPVIAEHSTPRSPEFCMGAAVAFPMPALHFNSSLCFLWQGCSHKIDITAHRLRLRSRLQAVTLCFIFLSKLKQFWENVQSVTWWHCRSPKLAGMRPDMHLVVTWETTWSI